MPTPSILSAAEREREYSPSSAIGGNYQPYIAAYVSESASARKRTTALGATWSVLSYGKRSTQTIELCLPPAQEDIQPAQTVPLLIFIHGGYWQELSAQDSLFAALGCLQQGSAFAAINYTLAPAASLADIIQECTLAVQHLHASAAQLGIDPQGMVLAGSSAGAHLAACVAQPCLAYGITLRGVVLVSGIYDLTPLIGTSINTALGLDETKAQAASPARMPCTEFPPTVICWGEQETTAFKTQSQQFAAQLVDTGVVCKTFEVKGRNHFDVIMDLCEPSTKLGQATLNALASQQYKYAFIK